MSLMSLVGPNGYFKKIFTHIIFHFHQLEVIYLPASVFILRDTQFETRLLHVLLHIISQGINSALPIVYI